MKLSGDIKGPYVVEETRSDGRLVISPDTSALAIMERLGHEPATLAEFEAVYGPSSPLTARGNPCRSSGGSRPLLLTISPGRTI